MTHADAAPRHDDRPRRRTGVSLLWIPLGAGGSGLVRFNGRVYESLKARMERRAPLALFHTALEIGVPEGRFVVETMWPSPDRHVARRGVVVEGPVASRRFGALRMFRYEVRRWHEGILPDAGEAVGGPRLLSADPAFGRRLLDLVGSVPSLTWGRDELRTGDMWNSNSVVSWLLTVGGLAMEAVRPPAGGRAPGWDAGIAVARHHPIAPVGKV